MRKGPRKPGKFGRFNLMTPAPAQARIVSPQGVVFHAITHCA